MDNLGSLLRKYGVIIQDEGSNLGAVPILNFVGAGVSASISGAVATIAIAGGGGGGGNWTEVEIDFGPNPVYDASFTITDAAITSSAVKMVLVPCGKPATGRTADDWQWDGGSFAANPGVGSAECYATFFPGPIVGKRKLQYQVV